MFLKYFISAAILFASLTTASSALEVVAPGIAPNTKVYVPCDYSAQHNYDYTPRNYEFSAKRNFGYIKMGAGMSLAKGHRDLGPTIGIGYRIVDVNDCCAVDLSFNFTAAKHESFYSMPRIMYLYYFNPNDVSSLYVGGGLSFGFKSINKHHHKSFKGLEAEAVVGYEFNRFSNIRTFVELNLSQPVLAAGSHRNNYKMPVLTLSAGIGF